MVKNALLLNMCAPPRLVELLVPVDVSQIRICIHIYSENPTPINCQQQPLRTFLRVNVRMRERERERGGSYNS